MSLVDSELSAVRQGYDRCVVTWDAERRPRTVRRRLAVRAGRLLSMLTAAAPRAAADQPYWPVFSSRPRSPADEVSSPLPA
jgi:hypothetical protein